MCVDFEVVMGSVETLHNYIIFLCMNCKCHGERRSRDRMIVGFTATYAIGAYHL